MIKFKIAGDLRYLSHRETIRLWQRALVRAGLPIRYSQGFNPRPKLSLPLPRSVGVESDAELLCVEVNKWSGFDRQEIIVGLNRQLPSGCFLVDIEKKSGSFRIQPCSAVYVFPVPGRLVAEVLAAADEMLKKREQGQRIVVERFKDKKSAMRNVDVTDFIESVYSCGDGLLAVQCRITQAGSIRVNEIMSLLRIESIMLADPVKRISVDWQSKN